MSNLRKNEEIQEKEVLLIDEEGKNIGVVNIEKALDIAQEKELDLVEVTKHDGTSSAICKLIDYNKFRRKSKIKAKNNKKQQGKSFKIKAMRLSLDIHDNDLNTKISKVSQWIDKGYFVKVFCILKGFIGISRKSEAKGLMEDFTDKCNGRYDAPISINARTMSCVIVKKK